ncbi:hypothetical protein VTJ04DRAFT_10676 [Mycothermus thermophilus]|uniref:uncharacterized protein n=1 Tax=Humicola insolens TaxID=85995 RepID=UPI00374238E8
MCRPLSDDAVKAMLGPALPPNASIRSVKPIWSFRPQRIFEVALSTGQTLHLTLPPISTMRPLRSEQFLLESEATTIRWIHEALEKEQRQPSPDPPSPVTKTHPNDAITTITAVLPTLLHHRPSSHAVYSAIRGTPLCLLSPTPSPAAQRKINAQLGRLFRSLATLSSPTGRFGPVAAVVQPSSRQSPSPSSATRKPITTTGEAGSSPPLLQQPPPLPKVLIEGGLSATSGADSWRVAFQSMLESVLRDGEDMMVAMSYATIRRHVKRLGYVLDEVRRARLVVLDGGEAGNVLVVDDDDGMETEGEGGWRRVTGLRSWGRAIFGDPLLAGVWSDPLEGGVGEGFMDGFCGDEELDGQREEEEDGAEADPGAADTDTTTADATTAEGSTTTTDPAPSTTSFSSDTKKPLRPNAPNLPYPLPAEIIDSPSTAYIRILLYQLYHAISHIVREYYRPRQLAVSTYPFSSLSTTTLSSETPSTAGAAAAAAATSSSSGQTSTGPTTTSSPPPSAETPPPPELQARKKLNEVLKKLADIPDDVFLRELGLASEGGASGGKRRARGDGEMSPAKRVRGDEEDW